MELNAFRNAEYAKGFKDCRSAVCIPRPLFLASDGPLFSAPDAENGPYMEHAEFQTVVSGEDRSFGR